MKIRVVAALAITAGLGLSLTACNLAEPQRTTLQYAASDGVNVSLDGVDVRNALIIGDFKGDVGEVATANLVFAAVNTTGKPATLTVGAPGLSQVVDLAAPDKITPVGYEGAQPIVLSGAPIKAGQTVSITFTASNGQTQTKDVPVVGSDFVEYSTIAPKQPTSPSSVPGEPGTTPAATTPANA